MTEEDNILAFSLDRDIMTLLAAARRNGLRSPIYCLELDYTLVKEAVERGEDISELRTLQSYDPFGPDETETRFRDRFEDLSGTQASFAAALSYDGTLLLLHAIRTAMREHRTADPMSLRAKVAERLRAHHDPSLPFIIHGDHDLSSYQYGELETFDFKFDPYGEPYRWNQKTEAPVESPHQAAAQPCVEEYDLHWATWVGLAAAAVMSLASISLLLHRLRVP